MGNFYMVKSDGHIRIYFPGTPGKEAIEFIKELEHQGYDECSWLRWQLKVLWLKFKSWWFKRSTCKTTIQGREGLNINIVEKEP